MKMISFIAITTLFSINLAYAGCGTCTVHKKTVEAPATQDIVITIAEDGTVNGAVKTSCGMCNFGMKDQKECNLAIQIGENSYLVQGSKMNDHGDAHAKDGMCNAIRTANVLGKVTDNIFVAETFQLQEK